ncbi:uncharacterized protein LOC117126882 [Brassica rapa]|uniref:uncharacterized protein LOC117126882 n=1 Tax=Brassica campestris TaxID=3711 RepID=UPI00142D9E75|nr:uncharacterized protein LOC117126882 [Brassica rapa]
MSSSSFTSGNYYRRRRNTERGTPKECWCGAPSDIFTSGSETNPGRLYYCCAKGYHKSHLFKWADECLVEEVEDIKAVINGMNRDISELRVNVAQLANGVKTESERKGGECLSESRCLRNVVVCVAGMAILCYYYFSMDVSDVKSRGYPPRFYLVGSSNLENKDINHNFRSRDLPHIIETLGEDVWKALVNSPIGVVARLVERRSVWSGRTVHYLLCRQLRVHRKEIWSLVVDEPIKFSLVEFCEITGLNTGPLPTKSFEPDPDKYKPFWAKLKVSLGRGPTLDELKNSIEVCPSWTFEECKWLGLLVLQHMVLYCLHQNSRVPFESAKRVFDDEAMKSYPWGRTAYEVLIDSIKMLAPDRGSYTLSGLKDALLIWAYESIVCFGECFGRVVNNEDVPLLRWGGKRTRANFENLLSAEIKQHSQVRVRRMVSKESIEELLPEWSCQPDDPQLVNSITDIHAGRFVKGFWEVHGNAEGKGNEKKKKAEPPTKKQNKVKTNEGEAAATGKGSSEEEGNKDSGNNASLMAIASTLDKLSSKFDLMDARFKKPLVDQKLIDDMVKVTVEECLKVMGIGKNPQNKENLSNVAADQQPEPLSSPQPNTQQKSVCSPLLAETLGKDMGPRNNLSNELDKERGMKKLWLRSLEHMLKMRATKAEDLRRRSTRNRTIKDEDAEDKKKTVQAEAVLKKKEKAAAKRKAAASMKQKQHELKKPKQAELMNEEQAELKNQEQAELMNEELAELKNQEADNEKRKNITTPRANLKRCKVEDSVEDSEFAVMTDEVLAEENEILPESPMASQELIRSAIVKEYREKTVNYLHKAPVDPIVLDKLMQHISRIPPKPPAPAKKRVVRSAAREGDFYSILILERPWPHSQYGWLFDDHICAYINVLFKRSMRDPTPFWTKRIAFIDPWFLKKWVDDYKQFKIKPNMMKFTENGYENLVHVCGVLALGVSFAGINDKNIQGLRLKMAAEILDEGGNMA